MITVTVALGSALWMADIWRRGVESSPGVRLQTLAVLPLENLSGDAADDYFTDGMTDALITDLASIHSLNVIARQSTKQYKGSTKPVSTIAKELGGVDAVIEGSVLRTGDRVRLIVQLIDARTERHLWARTDEQNLSDILQLQRDAALASNLALRPQRRSHRMRIAARHLGPVDTFPALPAPAQAGACLTDVVEVISADTPNPITTRRNPRTADRFDA
jgi:TolB-like protein